MPRVSCRCGESLDYDPYGPDRIDCPKCGAKIRIRRRLPCAPEPESNVIPIDDGFIRFRCPCGRRLKIKSKDRPEAGRCPDCGRIVPVPDSFRTPPSFLSGKSRAPAKLEEVRTTEMSAEDLARLSTWARHWQAKKQAIPPLTPGDRSDEGLTPAIGAPIVQTGLPPAPSAIKMEAGLRVCPRCGKPVHLGAANCRECGASVPRR